jgi:hypothetical protein
MKTTIALISALALLPLAACDKGKGDDSLASNVASAADNQADVIDNQAAEMKNEADQVRQEGKDRAAAIDAGNVDANAMSAQEREAIIENKAPAVR